MNAVQYIDLNELNVPIQPSYDWQDGSMHRQETLIRNELIARGYVCNLWVDGERDSFGPLSRKMSITTPEGDHKVVVYG